MGASELNQKEASAPTIFHITHWKAGSQWIHKILVGCVPGLIVPPQVQLDQFLTQPLQRNKVYPTLYVTKQQFDSVHLPTNWRRFVIIRDLRDALISAYFSLKIHHPIFDYEAARRRAVLQSLSTEDGFLYLMDEWLPKCAAIQASWLEAGERLIRYEDLLKDDLGILAQVLLDECELPVSRERFREVVLANRFEELTKGRQRGQEDATAHERKGIAGDWRNYFNGRVNEAFMDRYGDLLVATGYEVEQSTIIRTHPFSFNSADLEQRTEPTTVERLLCESIQRLSNEVIEKERGMNELRAEAERHAQALEVVTTDRDAWRARYQQIAKEVERQREALRAVAVKLDLLNLA